jgi:acyl carrier protein
VLTAARQLAGIGELGEIYVRTPYLSNGYLGDDGLTQERFVVNPFAKRPSDRLYKTGDRGRYLPDGSVEFAGRADHQVKIRGFRVELGEIETFLERHPAVRECAVVARHDTGEGQSLAAYLLTEPGQTPASDELRKFLKSKLPEYMLPSVFVFLDAFPLTPNGKVDRRALPAPDQDRPSLEQTFVAPRTPVENDLATIWAEVLKLDRVGVHDNFFDVGGHSLLATKLVSRIRGAFNIELPLRAFFERPTIAELAESVTQGLANKAEPSDMGDMLASIESLSEEETRRLLDEQLDSRRGEG